MTESGNAPEATRRYVVVYREASLFSESGKFTSFLFHREQTELVTNKPGDQAAARRRADKPANSGSFRFGYRLVVIVRDGDSVVELVSQQLFGEDEWFPVSDMSIQFRLGQTALYGPGSAYRRNPIASSQLIHNIEEPADQRYSDHITPTGDERY